MTPKAGLLSHLSVAVCIMVVLAAWSPSDGQPGLHRLYDPNGFFSIALPADWQVADPAISETMFGGFHNLLRGYRVLSKWAADSVPDAPAGSPIVLMVVALDLPEQETPAQVGRTVKSRLSANWVVTRERPARIAGRDAYTVNCRTQNTGSIVHMMMAYFTVGRTAFVAVGSMYGEEAAIQRHFATISRILDTFQPGATRSRATQ
jgi:hypothetical protein